jgi:metal transporter CNNM
MAVVVPSLPKDPISAVKDMAKPKGTIWTASGTTNARIMARLKASKGSLDYIADYMASPVISEPTSDRKLVLGIRTAQPIGIITFEDIIDTILQKTSRDERDFFDRENGSPRTKAKKSGDYPRKPVIGGIIPNSTISGNAAVPVPVPQPKSQVSLDNPKQFGTMRKRKASGEKAAGLDGVDDRSVINYPVYENLSIKKKKVAYIESSYTENSGGGFHGPEESEDSIDAGLGLTEDGMAELENNSSSGCPGNTYSLAKAVSLPSRKIKMTIGRSGVQKGMRHVSASPILPAFRGVASLHSESNGSQASFVKGDDAKIDCGFIVPTISVTSPTPTRTPQNYSDDYYFTIQGEGAGEKDLEQRNYHAHFAVGLDGTTDGDYDESSPQRKWSGETVTLSSWRSGKQNEEVESAIFDALPAPARNDLAIEVGTLKNLRTIRGENSKIYDGFPVELLDQNQEARSLRFVSKTMPRSLGLSEIDNFGDKSETDLSTKERDERFHDDRAMLPSQSQTLENGIQINPRSSSWGK